MSVDMNMIKVGPAGPHWGTAWDEKGKGEIAKIFVSHDETKIQSLQFLFVENGHFVLSDRHGAAHNKNFTTVALDFPSEFLTSIRGFGETYPAILKSITFVTNKHTYGPYGKMAPSPTRHEEFIFQLGVDRCFGGFHGTKRSNDIESIGVYVKTVTPSMITPTNSQVRVTPGVTVKREED